MSMTTVKELRRIPGTYELDNSELGQCLVVLENQFKPGWIESLERQGQRCIKRMLNNKAVVLVKLEIGEARDISTDQKAAASVEKTPLKEMWPDTRAKNLGNPPSYSPEEDKFLMDLYKRDPPLTFPAINALFSKAFPERIGKTCGSNRLASLIHDPANGLQPRRHYKESVGGDMWGKMWQPNEDKLLTELWNRQPHMQTPAITKEFQATFPKRKSGGIETRISYLQRKGTIQPRWKLNLKAQNL